AVPSPSWLLPSQVTRRAPGPGRQATDGGALHESHPLPGRHRLRAFSAQRPGETLSLLWIGTGAAACGVGLADLRLGHLGADAHPDLEGAGGLLPAFDESQ